MRSVVEAYERDGLFETWGFRSIWTHVEGSAIQRVWIACKAYCTVLWLLLMGKVSFMHVHAAMRGSFWRKMLFIATARYLGVPSIMHLHGSEMETFYSSLPNFGKRMVRWSLEHVEIVIVLSESWRLFVSQVAPKAKIEILNNYVTIPKLSGTEVPKNTFDVLFLGVLGHRKGIYDLLACWPQVIKAVPNARLLVGGNGEIDKAKSFAASAGLGDSVQFLGWIGGEQKLDLLRDADAFVLPSYNEGLPMSVLEAMSWSKPVITTRVGGIPELITDQWDGYLIQPGEQLALAARLIALGNDPVLRHDMGARGRLRVATAFSDSAILPKLSDIYAALVSKN